MLLSYQRALGDKIKKKRHRGNEFYPQLIPFNSCRTWHPLKERHITKIDHVLACKGNLKKMWKREGFTDHRSNKNPIRLEINDKERELWKFINSFSFLMQPSFPRHILPGDTVHKKLHLTVKAERWLWCSSQWLPCPWSIATHWLKGWRAHMASWFKGNKKYIKWFLKYHLNYS